MRRGVGVALLCRAGTLRRMGARVPVLLVLATALVAVGRVVALWDRLPKNMASHFDGSGRPDGFTTPVTFFWTFAGIGGGVLLLLLATPHLVRRLPTSLINLPNREYWLAPARRDEAVARLGRLMAWFTLALALFLYGILELVLHANLTRSGLPSGPFIALLAGIYGATAWLLVAVYRGFRVPRDAQGSAPSQK